MSGSATSQNQLRDASEGLDALSGALREFTFDVQHAPQLPAEPLGKLRSIVEEVGHDRPARPLICPDEYRMQWEELLAGKRTELDTRAVRFLCWEADIATDPQFHEYLKRSRSELRPRALQGLVHSCHMEWNEELFGTTGVARAIRQRLRSYDGPNRIIRRWQSNERLILDQNAPRQFAAAVFERKQPIKDVCEAWAIDEQSRYVVEGVRAAVSAWRRALAGSQRLSNTEGSHVAYVLPNLIFWRNWPVADFKEQVAQTILLDAATGIPDLQTQLKQLVLRDERLGDPRLPATGKNWRGVEREAYARFLSWLSADDIEFFFEHVLPRGRDPHGRKAFWLRYVNQVRMSRPLLN